MKISWLLAGTLLMASHPLWATNVVIRMRTQGAGGVMVFEPSFVRANEGDTIRFVPADPGHNAEPIPGMLPAGVTLAPGKVSQDYVVTLAKSGLYGFKCLPHFSMGMVALVQVGKGPPVNLASVTRVLLPPLATKRMSTLLAQVK